jgi:hypothetical protein
MKDNDKEIFYSRIRDEINNDPLNLGYIDKTNEEIVKLINNPTFITITTSIESPSILEECIQIVLDQFIIRPTTIYITNKGICNDSIVQEMLNNEIDKYKGQDIFSKRIVINEKKEVINSRISTIVDGLAEAKNIITEKDIHNAFLLKG